MRRFFNLYLPVLPLKPASCLLIFPILLASCGQDPLINIPIPITQEALSPDRTRSLFQQARQQKLFRFTINGKADLKMSFAESKEDRYKIKAENLNLSAYPAGSKFAITMPVLKQIPDMVWDLDESGLTAILTWKPHNTYTKAADFREIITSLMLQAKPPDDSGQPIQIIERRIAIKVKKTLQTPVIQKVEMGRVAYQRMENKKFYPFPSEPVDIRMSWAVHFQVKNPPNIKYEKVAGDFSFYPKLARISSDESEITDLNEELLERMGQPRYKQKTETPCQSPSASDSSCFEEMTEKEISKVKINDDLAVFERRCFLKDPSLAVYKKQAGYMCYSESGTFKKIIGETAVPFCFVKMTAEDIEKGFLADNIFVAESKEKDLREGAEKESPSPSQKKPQGEARREAREKPKEKQDYTRLASSHLACEYQAIPLYLLLEMAGYKPAELFKFAIDHSRSETFDIYVEDSNYTKDGPKLRREEARFSLLTLTHEASTVVDQPDGRQQWKIRYRADIAKTEDTEYAKALERFLFGRFSDLTVDFHVLSANLNSRPFTAVFNIFPKIQAKYQYIFDSDQTEFSQEIVTKRSNENTKTEIKSTALSLTGQIAVSHLFPDKSAELFLKHTPLKANRPAIQAETLDHLIEAHIKPELTSTAAKSINICARESAEAKPPAQTENNYNFSNTEYDFAVMEDIFYPAPAKKEPEEILKTPLKNSSCSCRLLKKRPLKESGEEKAEQEDATDEEENALEHICHFQLQFQVEGKDSGYEAYDYGIDDISRLHLRKDIFHKTDRLTVFEPERSYRIKKNAVKAGFDSANSNSGNSFHVFYNLSPEIYCANSDQEGKKDCAIYYPISKMRQENPAPPFEEWIFPHLKCETNGAPFDCPCETAVQFHPAGFALTDSLILQQPGLSVRCSFDKKKNSLISAQIRTEEPNIFFLDNLAEQRKKNIHQTSERILEAPDALME